MSEGHRELVSWGSRCSLLLSSRAADRPDQRELVVTMISLTLFSIMYIHKIKSPQTATQGNRN